MYFENAQLLFLSLFSIIPLLAIIWETKKSKKIEKFVFRSKQETLLKAKQFRTRIIIKNICFSLFLLCLSIACANPYWGMKVEPIQKNGNSVALVFDVSWSMTCTDSGEVSSAEIAAVSENEISRLEKAKKYVNDLMLSDDENEKISLSVVATKGSAVTLVPQTEDYNAAFSAINSLSPLMITNYGSNIGLGIEQALSTFQDEVARQNTILVFTDCEETDGSIEKALFSAALKGVNVFIIGFGSKNGSQVVSGGSFENDSYIGAPPEKKLVHTFLDEEKISSIVKTVQKKSALKNIKIEYYNSNSEQGKQEIFSTIHSKNDKTFANKQNSQQLGYEVKILSHHKMFTFLAILFLSLGVFVGFYKFSSSHTQTSHKTSHISMIFVLILSSTLFSSCKSTVEQKIMILQGSFYWHQGNYQKAEMKFLKVLNDSAETKNEFVEQYAILGLGSSYAMQNEEISSFERLKSIPQTASDSVKFSANYNMALLSFSKGDYPAAKMYFRKALEINPTSIDAKINYELALWHTEKDLQNQNETKNAPLDSQSILKESLFSIIRESDKNIWKNAQKTQENQNQLDY